MSNIHRPVFLLVIAFCLFAAWSTYNADIRRSARGNASLTSVPQAVATPNMTVHQKIGLALQLTGADLRRRVDVNRDGRTNCIDAAVLFYGHFPDTERHADGTKVNVRIMQNNNPNTNFNHLFNVVKVNGIWRAVEPQSRWRRDSGSYWMRDVWGARYDHTINTDETQRYLRYVRRSKR